MAEFKTKNKVDSKTGKPEKSGFLGVRRIAKDLREMPKWFKWFMLGAIIVILFFEFFNTQGKPGGGIDSFFEPIAKYNFVLEKGSAFGKTNGAAIAVAVLYSLNGLASFTGILAISLICYNKVSQWFWQIINAFFFGLMAISVSYLGDMIMQIIIILGCPIGWYLNESGKTTGEDKHNWKYNLIFALGLIVVITIITLVLYEFLPAAFDDIFKNGNNPYTGNKQDGVDQEATRILDSMTNGFNVVAYVMQVVNISNQFMVWPFVDILKIIKYSGATGPMQMLPNLIVEFVVWLSMCLIGTYERLVKGTKLDIFAKLRK